MAEEIKETHKEVCKLKNKLSRIENALCKLLKTRSALEQDIAFKERTIHIDSAICLGLRMKMPMDPKIGPVLVRPTVQC